MYRNLLSMTIDYLKWDFQCDEHCYVLSIRKGKLFIVNFFLKSFYRSWMCASPPDTYFLAWLLFINIIETAEQCRNWAGSKSKQTSTAFIVKYTSSLQRTWTRVKWRVATGSLWVSSHANSSLRSLRKYLYCFRPFSSRWAVFTRTMHGSWWHTEYALRSDSVHMLAAHRNVIFKLRKLHTFHRCFLYGGINITVLCGSSMLKFQTFGILPSVTISDCDLLPIAFSRTWSRISALNPCVFLHIAINRLWWQV